MDIRRDGTAAMACGRGQGARSTIKPGCDVLALVTAPLCPLPVRAEGLVRVVRLMLAHGRVGVTMSHGRQEATQCPLRTGLMLRGAG